MAVVSVLVSAPVDDPTFIDILLARIDVFLRPEVGRQTCQDQGRIGEDKWMPVVDMIIIHEMSLLFIYLVF